MKIITTVGTSLFNNARLSTADFDANDDSDETTLSGQGPLQQTIRDHERILKQYLETHPKNGCAEIASIDKIDPAGQAQVFLLCTETLASYICGRVIQAYLANRAITQVIKGLQVKHLDRFKSEGIPNLLSAMEKIAQNGNYWDDVVLNITGGYKALIPIVSMVGQIRQLPTFYMFKGEEDQNYELIEFPKMPIGYQNDLLGQYKSEFSLFGHTGNEVVDSASLEHNFTSDCAGFLDSSDGMTALNPIGKVLWWNYQQDYFSFNTTNEIYNDIQRQKNIKRILINKFRDSALVASKTEIKGDHLVFDDGNNNNRIYYFIDNKILYIYKTFQSEEEAKRYIDTPFEDKDKQDFISKAKPFTLTKNN